MLLSLDIRNLATIESAHVEFAPGLNAITGETGAGKSLLINGLELALGGRAQAESVRAGAALGVVEARFSSDGLPRDFEAWLIGELGLAWNPGEALVLRREIARNGRNRCLIGEQLVGVADLRRAGEWLIDFHGQHEHQSLLRADAPRHALDAFADHAPLIAKYDKAWDELGALLSRSRELEAAAADFQKRLEYLTYQLDEIDKFTPVAGEWTALEQEEKLLANAEAHARAATEAFALLYEGPGDEQRSALAILADVARRLNELAEVAPEFAAHAAALEDSKAGLEDLAWTLNGFAERTEANPERLNEVITRREALRALIRKHAGGVGAPGPEGEAKLIEAWAAMHFEREVMAQDDAERFWIVAKITAGETVVREAGEKLGASRRKAAAKMKKQVESTLHELAMEKARFEVSIEPLAEPASGGLEQVDFLLAANVGLPAAPLRKVASGGELSRVMLALKSALAARDALGTLVFDEIDTGISGETSRRVGKQMETLAESHQIICITHHAAIAARAQRQFDVTKRTIKTETYTEIETLKQSDRIEALAHMMGGHAAGDEARELARRLMS